MKRNSKTIHNSTGNNSSDDKIKENWFQSLTKWISKNLLALAALAISYFAFQKNSENYDRQEKLANEQKRQWNAINLARVSVIKAKFLTFGMVTRQEILKDSLAGLQDVSDEDNRPNFFMIKYLTNGFDNTTHKNILCSSISPSEYVEEMKMKKQNMSNVTMVKVYNPVITIKNVGQTSCTIDNIIRGSLQYLYKTTNFHSGSAYNLKQ